MSDRDPLEQLSRLRLDVDPGTRASHLDAIDAELARRPSPQSGRGRRWMLGVVVAMLLAGPVTAVASDRAVPGDLLYPVKQVLEPIVRLIDDDVVAEHRVEEVGELVRRGGEDGVIESQVAAARDALADTDAPVLERELDRIVDWWSGERRSTAGDATDVTVPTTSVPADRLPLPSTEERPADLPTTTVHRDEPPAQTPTPSDRTTTTTTTMPAGVDVRPPPDDVRRDRP